MSHLWVDMEKDTKNLSNVNNTSIWGNELCTSVSPGPWVRRVPAAVGVGATPSRWAGDVAAR